MELNEEKRRKLKRKFQVLSINASQYGWTPEQLLLLLHTTIPLPPPPPPSCASLETVTLLLSFVQSSILPPPPPPFPSQTSSKPSHALLKTLFPTCPEVKNTEKAKAVDVFSALKSRAKDFYDEVKFTIEEFQLMLQDLRCRIEQPYNSNTNMIRNKRRHKLTTENRLLLVLIWLADNSKFINLQNRFGVSASTVSREIHHIIPAIVVQYQAQVCWPDDELRQMLRGTMPDVSEDAIGKGDFTTHPVPVSLHLQHLLYRADKHRHVLNSFAVSDFIGLLRDFEPGFSHNNDTNLFALTELGKGNLKLQENEKILVDGGIHDQQGRLIGPYQFDNPILSRLHKAERVGIETEFKNLKGQSNTLRSTFRLGTHFQPEVALASASLYNFSRRLRLESIVNLHEETGITDFLTAIESSRETLKKLSSENEDDNQSFPNSPSLSSEEIEILDAEPDAPITTQPSHFPASPSVSPTPPTHSEDDGQPRVTYYRSIISEFGRCLPSTIMVSDPFAWDVDDDPSLKRDTYDPFQHGWRTSIEESYDC